MDTIISTIPWTLWRGYCELPQDIETAVATLKNAPIDVDYHAQTLDSPSHWTYEPDETVSYHRLLLRSNFVPGARGYLDRIQRRRSTKTKGVRFHNEFAYPVNTLGKPEVVEKILAWGRSQGIVGLGIRYPSCQIPAGEDV